MAKIKHIAISTQDTEKTANFYKEVFDLKMVGQVDGENAEGYYLSDGNVNLAILRFKNEAVAGERGTSYSGIHHLGLQVEDLAATDAKLRDRQSLPMESVNSALQSRIDEGHSGRNVEVKYDGPDGVMIDVSQGGWVGT